MKIKVILQTFCRRGRTSEIFIFVKVQLLTLWWTILRMDNKSINTLFLFNLIKVLHENGKDVHEIWEEVDNVVKNPHLHRWGTIELAIRHPELGRKEIIELLREEQIRT